MSGISYFSALALTNMYGKSNVVRGVNPNGVSLTKRSTKVSQVKREAIVSRMKGNQLERSKERMQVRGEGSLTS